MSSFISVDVESDGPIQGIHSMVCFGAVIVEPSLNKTFYGQIQPISEIFDPEALAISGFSREQHLQFDDPVNVMYKFATWIKSNTIGTPILVSDNNGYDAAWINYYFHRFYGKNPFGWSSRRIGDLYCGVSKDLFGKWKHLRGKILHDHNPVNDAKGNANAMLEIIKLIKSK